MLLKKDRESGNGVSDIETTSLPLDIDEELPLGVRAMMTFTNRFYGSF